MLKIAVYFNEEGKNGYPLDEQEYAEAYREFAERIAQKGGRLHVVRTQQSYLGGNRFSGGWRYEDGELADVPQIIEADVIFNKGNLVWDDTATVINVRDVEDICTDKSKTYELFPHLFPLSLIAHNKKELQDACDRMQSDTVVAKPLDKEGGEGVMVAPKNEVLKSVQSFPYIIQEFIDTSGGIPGLIEGSHDFRIASVNGDIMFCECRQPKQGSFIANASQGGSFNMLPLSAIPPEALVVFREVDSVMSRFPLRVYAVDMGRNTNGTWKLIELNAKPGFLSAAKYPEYGPFQDRVADLLLEVAESRGHS
jgi:glutathione synthase/RimK-type ligase-like ATP-grasp enzyme